MGRALAEVAAARGADVTLVTTAPSAPEGMVEIAVGSATEMLKALEQACANADVVGFAAETEDLRAQAQQKLGAKQLDMIVANQVGVDGQGLASDFNAVTIVTPAGVVAEVPRLPKVEVAGRIWDAIDAGRNTREIPRP